MSSPDPVSPPNVPRRRRPRRRTVRFFIILVTVVLVGNTIAGESGLIAMLRSTGEFETLSRMIEVLRAENDVLREGVRRLREEPGTIEELARYELGLIQPGEKLFIVTNRRADPDSLVTAGPLSDP